MMKKRIYIILLIVTIFSGRESIAAVSGSGMDLSDGEPRETLSVSASSAIDTLPDSRLESPQADKSPASRDSLENVVEEVEKSWTADSSDRPESSWRLLDQPLSERALSEQALSEQALSEKEKKQDTLSNTGAPKARFLPTRRRIDREINRNRFIFKREVAAGLTVSYGVISSDETDFMLLLDNLNFKGSVFTINPSVGYFIKDNLSVGVRFGYSKTRGDISSLALNLGSSNDLDISLSDLHLTNNAASVGVFMRSYAGIDARGHFGLFAELELSCKNGETVFSYLSNGVTKYTRSNSQQYKFSFNPGCAVFIFPNVCSTLSFGLGGLQYTKIKQTDDQGNVIGQREAAKMRFRLNLLNIRIGLNILL